MCEHFMDRRIRFVDSLEVLTQSVASFVSVTHTLKIIENLEPNKWINWKIAITLWLGVNILWALYRQAKMYICFSTSFLVLCSLVRQLALIRSLLRPYEDRVWAQGNWILVRVWKGSGFGYRHYTSPHLRTVITPKPTFSETGLQLIC